MSTIRHANRVTAKPGRVIRADGSTGYRSASVARAAAGTRRYDRDTRTEAAGTRNP